MPRTGEPIDLDEDDGALVEEVYENLPSTEWGVKRYHVRIVLETLVRLDYDIVWYSE